MPPVSVGTVLPELRRHGARAQAARTRAVVADPAALAVIALTLLAAALRFYHLGHQGFWFDEANASNDMRLSPGKMLGLLPQNQTTPPLYYLVGWVWARAFGFSEVPLRSLSALAGVATVPIVYVVARRMLSARAGLIAAALAACNPFLIWYSQEARPYELLVLLTALGLLAFDLARREPTGRRVVLWAVVSALALATHYYALLVVVPEALWLLYLHRRRWPVVVAVALVGAGGVGLLPLAISQNHTGNASWIAKAALLPRLGAIVPQFLVAFQSPARPVLVWTAVLVALGALVLLALRADVHERRASLAMGALVAVGLVLNLLLIAVGIDDLITRNIIALWLPAALLVAGGLGARRAGMLGIAGALTLCVIGVVATLGVAFNRDFQRPDWRVVASSLGSRPTFVREPVAPRAILVQHYGDLLPLSMYLPKLKFMPRGGAAVRELDVVSFTSPPSAGFCWWGSACNLWPSRMQTSYPVAGFHAVSERRALQFTILRMVSARPIHLTPSAVARVLRATDFRNDELLIQRP
jgi:mannosyltransferase